MDLIGSPSIVFVCVQSCTGRLNFCGFLNGEKPKKRSLSV